MIKFGEIRRRITSTLARATRGVRAHVKTRHTRELEAALARERAEAIRQRAEIARLRQENRALLNSILGIAGIPPIPVTLQGASASEAATTSSAENPRNYPSLQPGSEAPALGPVSPSTDANAQTQQHPPAATHAQPHPQTDAAATRGKNLAQVPPMRRRSWQQINRTLEFEAARKKAGREAEGSDA